MEGSSSSVQDPSLPPVAAGIDSLVLAFLLGSHPMPTRAKAGIFKTRHLANLNVLGSSGFLYALLASIEPKGFKSAAKNPAWLATMDDKVHALQNNRTWILVPRLDYTNTFSPVIKATTICVVLSLAVTNRWPLRQLDVKNAFLNGTLIETVYMEQPPSFTRKLNFEFATKDLGSLSYFLGLEATFTNDDIFINQLKYTRDILTWAQLLDSKPVHTPMVVSQQLSRNDSPFSNPTLYRSLVGALQYLTITQLDIAHTRILRYVKDNLHFGLTFHSFVAFGALVAYSNADCAGYLDTLRSTSGYSIYLGDNLVSWSAKKQPTVSRSSCESEYRVLATTAAELLWLMHLLQDLKVPPIT
ncbi:uncharacterized mitochondrial protein AtMg00810-like [Carya illinoinensis]|uniref:uncharacterized mitochondrial protein AtMg00810-like n=1 Tax=Carya illinoinensis TaxID=32201 RepID=UPI001C72835E|nr:uncharacterized mitochondrial protein AtMg00810-like [Carya illinoinensis]